MYVLLTVFINSNYTAKYQFLRERVGWGGVGCNSVFNIFSYLFYCTAVTKTRTLSFKFTSG